MLRRAWAAAVVAAAVCFACLVGTENAQADPGYCAVKVSIDQGVDLTIIYTVLNRCDYPIRAGIFLQVGHRDGSPECRIIDPGRYVTYLAFYADNNWIVHNC